MVPSSFPRLHLCYVPTVHDRHGQHWGCSARPGCVLHDWGRAHGAAGRDHRHRGGECRGAGCGGSALPQQCYSRSLQQREECIPSLVSTPGFRCPTPGASVAFCLGLEKSRWLGWVEGHCSWVPFSCQMMCKSGGGGAAVRLLGCSHTPLPHPLASFLELKADSWGWVVA